MKLTREVLKAMLPFKGVLLQCLDEHQQPIDGAFATGFLMRETDGIYLYTCWHVVTGFDPYEIRVGMELPRRRYLSVSLQDVQRRQDGVEAIGGVVTGILPLYENDAPPFRPTWWQDNRHVAHAELNGIGLCVPFWHDAVKLKLSEEWHPSEIQVLDAENGLLASTSMVLPGDKCLIVGYPYGFSTFGLGQPTPIALTRFVAATSISNRHRQLLLESIGAPGMSGGPVFIERDQGLVLTGIYTGVIYPDATRYSKEKATALGTVTDLSLVFLGHLPLVRTPTERHDPSAA